ncbi:tetratricopeptide repeat protein [Tsuneonella mangrovi]|uniref:tetratricopeptide repeat protein n=1 Tax=Tsuneonella mangrovi TaxID=1982042 RepID=UPI000BA1C78E|nr:tetratricopeptide repeat protein [Tsuneonella mangrovi]
MALTPGKSLSREEKRAQQRAAEDEVLLREVDDAVRQDQYADFYRRYGKAIIGLVILGLAAFGGYLWYQEHLNAQRETASETLVTALDQVQARNLATGDKDLAPILEGNDEGAKTAAQMLKAGIAMEQKKPADAAKLFEAVAADPKAPKPMRDAATVRAVAASYDTMKPADVIARLQPLAVPGSPWFGSAGEMVAMAYLDQGKNAEAGKLFSSIAEDKDTPDTLKSRARQMAGLLGVDSIKDVDTVIKQPGINSEVAGGPAQ